MCSRSFFPCVMSAVLITGGATLGAQTPAPSNAPPAVQTEVSTAAEQATHATQVFVYPASGQSPEQLDRDRYECYVWAVEQTGFDPSQPALAPHQQVEVIPERKPGTDTAAGAVTGAVIGAVVSSPRHTAKGAVIGAVIGGAIGSASDATKAQETREAQQRMDAQEAERLARIEQQSSDYRRAITACLEGRGYTVK